MPVKLSAFLTGLCVGAVLVCVAFALWNASSPYVQIGLNFILIVAGFIGVYAARRYSIADTDSNDRNDRQHANHPSNNSNNPETHVGHPEDVSLESLSRQMHEYYETHKSEERVFWSRQVGTAKVLNYVTGVGAAVGFAGLVFIGISLGIANRSAHDGKIAAQAAAAQAAVTEKSVILSQRARIAVSGAGLNSTIAIGQPIRIALSLANTGREPSADINYRLLNSTIRPYVAGETDMRDIVVPDNNSCSDLTPVKGRLYAPPPNSVFNFNIDSRHGEPQFVANQEIVSGEQFYVARGFIAYNAIDGIHQSGFCYVLERHKEMETGRDQQGNAVVNPTPFLFSQCPKGFSFN